MTNQLVQQIQDGIAGPPTKEQIMVFLEQIRKTYYEERKKGMTHNKAISSIGTDI